MQYHFKGKNTNPEFEVDYSKLTFMSFEYKGKWGFLNESI